MEFDDHYILSLFNSAIHQDEINRRPTGSRIPKHPPPAQQSNKKRERPLETTQTPTPSHEERDVEKHPFNKPFRSSADEIISNLQALPLLAETISTSAPSAEAAEIVKNLLSSYYAVGYWMAKYETIMKNS